MHTRSCFFLLSITLLAAAADPPWIGKQLSDWSEQDATQVLAGSPWVKKVTPSLLPLMTPAQRRESGDMGAGGGGKGAAGLDGYDGIGLTGKTPTPAGKSEVAQTRTRLMVRWESALPIRAAELRTNDAGAPISDSDDYAIAVYGVSLNAAILDLKNVNEVLKRTATLKTEGKKDRRPSRVSVIEPGGGIATVVYFFPRAEKITLEDKRIDFLAQIGRLYVAEYFYPAEMRIQGKLEL